MVATGQGYEFDIFLSYSRAPVVQEWVRNHFYPRLLDWLGASMPYQPDVFVDWGIETGNHWPSQLERALLRSRCLVSIWSTHYFRSSWCMAEWQTMREREDLLGMRTVKKPQGLIYPVVFWDGEYFPKEAKECQHVDLREWNIPNPEYSKSLAYADFIQKMQSIAGELDKMIMQAPPWQDDWPVALPPPSPQVPNFSLPRIK